MRVVYKLLLLCNVATEVQYLEVSLTSGRERASSTAGVTPEEGVLRYHPVCYVTSRSVVCYIITPSVTLSPRVIPYHPVCYLITPCVLLSPRVILSPGVLSYHSCIISSPGVLSHHPCAILSPVCFLITRVVYYYPVCYIITRVIRYLLLLLRVADRAEIICIFSMFLFPKVPRVDVGGTVAQGFAAF